MKSILALIVVLIIGFFIGMFTNKGDSIFSFLSSGNNIQDGLTQNAEEAISQITSAAQKETGAIFDKQYLDAMITMYEGSVTMSKIGTVAGGKPELRSVAKTVSEEDAEVLAQLKKWRSEWYPTPTKSEGSTKPPFVK